MQNESIKMVLDLMLEQNKNKIYSLAKSFNEISGSDRILIADLYDCGTTARAIFMYLIKCNRSISGNLCLYEKDRIYNDYRYRSQEENVARLLLAAKILENMGDGVMMATIRYNNNSNSQFGHVWVIEKKDNKYYIYQSALNEYTYYDYYRNRGSLLKEGGPVFMESLKELLESESWTYKMQNMFMDKFMYKPETNIGLRLRPEFFYAYVEY